MNYSLTKIHQEIIKILIKTNNIIKAEFRKQQNIKFKSGRYFATRLVTETDKKIDDYLRQKLSINFPEFGFITEENKDSTKFKEYNWIIDPIDGTVNFFSKIPIFGTSIALWKKDQPIYGVLSFPMQSEIIYSYDGKVFYNDSDITIIRKTINFLPTFTYAHIGENISKAQILTEMLKTFSLPSIFKCCTYNIALVILGKIDCAVSINLSIWDIAAAIFIAKNAGLHIEFISSRPKISRNNLREYQYSFVLGSEELAKEAANKIKRSNLL